jgi:hypothetical protein
MTLMKPATSASRRPLERGQFSWVTPVLVLIVAAAGYLGWVWVPLYSTHFEVKQVVRDFMNQAVKNRDDTLLVKRMCEKIQAIEAVEGTDARGKKVSVPAADVEPGDVTWERDADASPPMLHVAFEYKRQVIYPYLDRVDEAVFSIDLTQDIEVPKWK